MPLRTNGLYKDPPVHLRGLLLKQAVREYQWDVESPFSLVAMGDAVLESRLRKLSSRALTAFSIGCVEWIVYGLPAQEGKDVLALYYLEGFWAYAMGREDHFAFPPELDHEEWATSTLSPIDCAISSVMNVIYLSQHYDPPAGDAARIPELVKHIYGTDVVNKFEEWKSVSVERLLRFGLRTDTDHIGGPIPRALLNPAIDLPENQFALAIASEFEAASFEANPFYGVSE